MEYSFEYDEIKSKSNREKHGIDFIEAQALWNDMKRIEIVAKTIGEARWLTIGIIENKHYSAVITYRNENIRIISVRPSRREEVALYEN
jgi:uncharacterized DUF497 family protein